MKFIQYTLLLWMLYLPAFGQEYGYTHYDSKDGLAGSTVYCMVQDRDGFLWFGTELGLSRFDGTHFKNFTKEDGLPDNEIIQLFADSKGRIWMAPFRKTVCYYYKGKIYTQENDPVLRSIELRELVARFAEDKAGNILMLDTKRLHLVTNDGRVTLFDSINNEQPLIFINGISANADNGFLVIHGNNIYDLRNYRFTLKKVLPASVGFFMNYAMDAHRVTWRTNMGEFKSMSLADGRTATFPLKWLHIMFYNLNDSLVGQCTKEGAVIFNTNNPDSGQTFLPGLPVNGMMMDREGSIWFTTLGHGVYKLSSPHVLNVKIRKNTLSSQALAFARLGQSILAGTEFNEIFRCNKRTGTPEKEMIGLKGWGKVNGIGSPITALSTYKDKIVFCGTEYGLYKLEQPDFKTATVCLNVIIKNLFLQGDKLYVANKDNVFVVNAETFTVTDTIWHERSTAVFASHDTVYIGTLGGLYRRLPNRSIQFLGETLAALKARITSIRQDAAGVLWIGTYGDGLMGYKNGHIVATLNRRNGLTSNVCRTLFMANNILWAGTDKGLNKIQLTQPGYPITKYTTGDGLSSDIINAVYVDSNKVFVGTPEGITFFDESKLISQSRCDLQFTDIVVGGTTLYDGQAPSLIPHEKNSIQFNFVGISYKSIGDIRYRYRLLGLDSNWKETRETFLSYPTLPSGDYQLQLQAINKFDVHSRLLTTSFVIDQLFYERFWFRLLVAVLFLAGTGLAVWFIIQRVRKREQEKTVFIKRISELEQLSRKAQMNPHFIFNSLNSIQQYVMDSDVAGANKFISGFSRLIRQTLDFSSKPEISLEEELDYLTNYLEIEKTRLENAFSWSVVIDPGVDPAEYYIPPMILQPFVENSVRHGLRFRRDKEGKVTITIKGASNHLVCIVEDNGVGRKAAMQYKSISPINYQSKGLSLTADRITMFNQEHEQKISMQIEDLEDEDHASLGTRVTISFPVL